MLDICSSHVSDKQVDPKFTQFRLCAAARGPYTRPMISIAPGIALAESEIELTFIRSSGPGGQNVNKVATAVQLRFDIEHSPSLPQPVRERLRKLGGNRVSRDGTLVITANRFRSQEQNRRDAVERLAELVRAATHVPRPRRPTKPSRAARARRVEAKRRHGEIKRLRAGKSDFT
jgi:ribosome-associated protein